MLSVQPSQTYFSQSTPFQAAIQTLDAQQGWLHFRPLTGAALQVFLHWSFRSQPVLCWLSNDSHRGSCNTASQRPHGFKHFVFPASPLICLLGNSLLLFYLLSFLYWSSFFLVDSFLFHWVFFFFLSLNCRPCLTFSSHS